MSTARTLRVVFAFACLVATPIAAQVPAALREAMQAFDEAAAKGDSAAWDRLTTNDFTIVLPDGTLRTKAEQLARFRAHRAGPPQEIRREQIALYGDALVHRALRQSPTGDAWTLHVWIRDGEAWRVAAIQVTNVRK